VSGSIHEPSVPSSIKGFLRRLIDYAGLFPPAALPLEQAIRNYAAYRNDKDAWMLGAFIVPAGQLDQLVPFMALFTAERPLALAVLGSRSADRESCIKLLDDSLKQVDKFVNSHGAAAVIEAFELPLPSMRIDETLLHAIAKRITKYDARVFLEVTVPLNGEWETGLLQALREIELFNEVNNVKFGVKLRTGGVTADAFPTPAQVAAALVACRDRQLPLKFTAGLHHPVRMFREEVNALMHGFLNIFVAGMIAHANRLDIKAVEEILADINPANFLFDEEGVHWRHFKASANDVQEIRGRYLLSYGSCSFDEPREELRQLNFL